MIANVKECNNNNNNKSVFYTTLFSALYQNNKKQDVFLFSNNIPITIALSSAISISVYKISHVEAELEDEEFYNQTTQEKAGTRREQSLGERPNISRSLKEQHLKKHLITLDIESLYFECQTKHPQGYFE